MRRCCSLRTFLFSNDSKCALWSQMTRKYKSSQGTRLPIRLNKREAKSPSSLIGVLTVHPKTRKILCYPRCPAETLLRLGECAGWAQSSLDADGTLYEMLTRLNCIMMKRWETFYGQRMTRDTNCNIGIKHGFSCINIRQVPREVLKTEAGGRGFQHLPRDLADVNALKNHVRSLLVHKKWKHLLNFALFPALFCFAFSPMSRKRNFQGLCSF